MKIHLLNPTLLLLALISYMPNVAHTAGDDNSLEQVAIERYCACKSTPQVSESYQSTGQIVLSDPEKKLEACHKKLQEDILDQSETIDIYAALKTAQENGDFCDRKQAKEWFRTYRELLTAQVDKLEKEINEKICGVSEGIRPNREQKKCRESLEDLILDTEKEQFFSSCQEETNTGQSTSRIGIINRIRRNRLQNSCIRNKTYSQILYAFESFYFTTTCTDQSQFDNCKKTIITNATPPPLANGNNSANPFARCKDSSKFNTEHSVKVCEQYLLRKVIGDATTDSEEIHLLNCLKGQPIGKCLANHNVDERAIAGPLKDMYCKAPEYTSEAEKNNCFTELLSNIEVPDNFDPDTCKNTIESLKAACLRKEYLKSLVDHENSDNKHFIISDCWNRSKYPMSTDSETPDWESNPMKVSGPQCDAASKDVFHKLSQCEAITPKVVTETNPQTHQTVTKVNPAKIECIKKITPKYLIDSYLMKLAALNKADITSCNTKTGDAKTECMAQMSYSIDETSYLGIAGGSNCLAGNCNTNSPSNTSIVNNGTPGGNTVTNLNGNPAGNNVVTGTVTVGGVSALTYGSLKTNQSSINGANLTSGGKDKNPGDSVQGALGNDINTTNRGSNWFSFFRDVKMMKKYKRATDPDCREIYHAAKTKIIGTVVSTGMVVGGGIAATSMISKEKKKPIEERNQKVYFTAAGIVTTAAVGAVAVNMAAVKSARTKLEKAAISLTSRAQSGTLDCGFQGTTAYIDFDQNQLSPSEQKAAVASINNSKSPMEAYMNYLEWEAYLNSEQKFEQVDELADISFEELENSYDENSFKTMKTMFISMLESSSNLIFPRAMASTSTENTEEPKEDKSAEYLQLGMKLIPLATSFIGSETGDDGTVDPKTTTPAHAVIDANGGVDDCETRGTELNYEYGERQKQDGALKELESQQT